MFRYKFTNFREKIMTGLKVIGDCKLLFVGVFSLQ